MHDDTRFDVSIAVNVTDVLPTVNGVPKRKKREITSSC
jgi:hypothetical protein